MKKIFRICIMSFCLAVFPAKGFAQLSIDALSLEAMVSNHKTVRTALGIRAALELGVLEAHENFQGSVGDYQKTSKQLDRYKRCFDIIDLILNGTATAYHGIRTYNSIKSNIDAYMQLLNEYNEKFLLKGNVAPTDAIVYTNSEELISSIKSSADGIYKSYIDLAAYLTGTAECSTASMMLCLQCINENMDDIDQAVKNAYLKLWNYMTMRSGFWKAEIFRGKTISELALEAYDSWKKSQYIAMNNNMKNGSKTIFKTLGGGGLLGGRKEKNESDL